MEHTSLELSRQLHDAGFKGEHKHIWFAMGNEQEVNWKDALVLSCNDASNEPGFHKRNVPAYTFTEIWGVLDGKQRKELLIHMLDNVGHFDLNDPAEVAGEWLIQEGHVQVSQ